MPNIIGISTQMCMDFFQNHKALILSYFQELTPFPTTSFVYNSSFLEDIKDICEDYFQRIIEIESEKWDIEHQIRKRANEVRCANSCI